MEEPAQWARHAQRKHPRFRLGAGAAVLIIMAALAASVVVTMFRTETAHSSRLPTPSASAAAPEQIYVHVLGEVVSPGLYQLDPGSRVADAVDAADGLKDEADPTAVNLARVLNDGEQIDVPAVGEEKQSGDSDKVSINQASAGELEALPQIGPSLAQRIIAWREEHGPFQDIDDLKEVSGIGDKTLGMFRDLITL